MIRMEKVACISAHTNYKRAECLLIYCNVIWGIKTAKGLLIWDPLNWKSGKSGSLGITEYLIFYGVPVTIHCCVFVMKFTSNPETISVCYDDFIVHGCGNGSNMCTQTPL